MKHPPSTQVFGPSVNRFSDLMAHTNRYAFRGVSRLAYDAGLSPSSVSRLINSRMNPSFIVVARLTSALEAEFGFHIDPRDLIAENGLFLTRFACDLAHCRGCLPDNASDEFGDLKPAFAKVKSGQWVTSRHPSGFRIGKEVHEG